MSPSNAPSAANMNAADPDLISKLSQAIASLHTSIPSLDVLPTEDTLSEARKSLRNDLPESGIGLEDTIRHLMKDLAPALNASSRSANYYGFVTGGSTLAASLADNLVTYFDQNVQVHLPNETLATEIEDRALTLLCSLLDFSPSQWPHRTFTTGATASNILGLACGREYIIAEASAHRTDAEISVGEQGIVEATRLAGIDNIQILTTVPHSSLSKAASVLGLGRNCVRNVGRSDVPHKFDMDLLQKHLALPGAASIVAISASEVNTGLFASSLEDMQSIRQLCDMYGAWIHVDGAFGIQARLLPSSPPYQAIRDATAGLELADSITGDGHKLLNVPYDCGFFLSRHRALAERVFKNPNAAYLAAAAEGDDIMSPLNIGLENSRRFRALPVYASLVAYGKAGYRDMLERQIALSRGIAQYIFESNAFELLPRFGRSLDEALSSVYIIVLFRAKDEDLNRQLVNKIKASRKIYVSGTSWEGRPACRFAVSNWMVNADRDLPVIKQVLEEVARDQHGA